MNRYFVRCKYNGTRFCGWQSQPGDTYTIQDEIERAIKVLLRTKVEIIGCGRTDTGVHALDYVFHLDADIHYELSDFLYKLNRIIDDDIFFMKIYPVAEDAHARYDARSRSYTYQLTTDRDPFRKETVFYYPRGKHLNIEIMNQVADLIIKYEDFNPFCKTGTDVGHKKCTITHCQWTRIGNDYIFDITANRFLRGMIRLIVGVTIFVAEGKISLQAVKHALDHQTRIDKNWSVPPEGLFLKDIIYEDD